VTEDRWRSRDAARIRRQQLRAAQNHEQSEQGDDADLDEQGDDLGVGPHADKTTTGGDTVA